MPSKPAKGPKFQEIQIPLPVDDYGLMDDLMRFSPNNYKKLLKNPLQMELWMFARGGSEYFIGGEKNPKGRPRAYHFWRAAYMLWNYPGSRERVDMHPWAVRMVDALCKNRRLSIAGCASSGKSRIMAMWGIVCFMAAPQETKVILTSTSLKDSRGRIWGDVEKLWQNMVAQGPGQLVSSGGIIRYYDHATDYKDDTRGLVLLAGEKSKETESIGKMKGFKAKRMIFIADELPDLSEALISAAEANLSSNPYFQFVGTGNPTSYYDPHGILSEPEGGWTSISELDYEWKGKRAYVIRFDAEKSPNFGPEGEKWPYLMTQSRLNELRRDLGERSLRYYCMVKGFWFPETAEDAIYSGVMLQTYGAHEKAVFKGSVRKVAGFDPSFTHGGDDSVLTIGKVGTSVDGIVTIERVATHKLYEDITNSSVSRSEQIAMKLKEICEKEGVAPEDLAVDATGGGSPWCDMLAAKWSNAFARIQFGGLPDDKEKYYNKMSELWFSGQPLIRTGQIRGVGPSLAREMTARTYTLKGKKVQVTPKGEMKAKLGRSPDEADSFFLMLAMAMKKHKLTSAEKPGGVVGGKSFVQKRMRELADIYAV